VVFETPDFLRYFHEVTPEGELANMNIGSRPSHRKKGKRTVGSIRAIPWIFAWTQVRSLPHHLPPNPDPASSGWYGCSWVLVGWGCFLRTVLWTSRLCPLPPPQPLT